MADAVEEDALEVSRAALCEADGPFCESPDPLLDGRHLAPPLGSSR